VKKRWLLALALCLACLSGTVQAANWVRVGSDEYYIDCETVVKHGDVLYYWEVTVDEAGYKRLLHFAVRLADPPRARLLSGYLFDAHNRLLNEIIRPHLFSVWPESAMVGAIHAALPYAAGREDAADPPALP
jgi:hypothetical protein